MSDAGGSCHDGRIHRLPRGQVGRRGIGSLERAEARLRGELGGGSRRGRAQPTAHLSGRHNHHVWQDRPGRFLPFRGFRGSRGQRAFLLGWRWRTAQCLLEEHGKLPADFYTRWWSDFADPTANVISLRAADQDHFSTDTGKYIERDLLAGEFVAKNPAPQLVLQAALSLGQSSSPKVEDALIRLSRLHGDLRWMDAAVVSSASGREKDLLLALAKDPGKGESVMLNLAGIIAARGEAKEIGASIVALGVCKICRQATGSVATWARGHPAD